MNTVNKDMADRIIAGEFPEKDIKIIIQYDNFFSAKPAYLPFRSNQLDLAQWILDSKESEGLANPSIYWRAE